MRPRPAHLERLRQLQDEGRLLLAGPCPTIDSPDPGPAGFTGSLIVAEFASLAQAQDWADADGRSLRQGHRQTVQEGLPGVSGTEPTRAENALSIEETFREKLAFLHPDRLELIDDSALHAGQQGARGGHYRLLIVSSEFTGKPAADRHHLVHNALDELMRTRAHALSIKLLAPGEAG